MEDVMALVDLEFIKIIVTSESTRLRLTADHSLGLSVGKVHNLDLKSNHCNNDFRELFLNFYILINYIMITLNQIKQLSKEPIISYSPIEALEAVKQDGSALQYIHKQTEEICLEAVKQNGYALRYVHKQTEEICLEAVKQDGSALQYIHKQTEEICLEAVKQDGYALRYIHKQTEEICLEAVKQNGNALQYVDESIFVESDMTLEEVCKELGREIRIIK
jgi:hypothetical protein